MNSELSSSQHLFGEAVVFDKYVNLNAEAVRSNSFWNGCSIAEPISGGKYRHRVLPFDLEFAELAICYLLRTFLFQATLEGVELISKVTLLHFHLLISFRVPTLRCRIRWVRRQVNNCYLPLGRFDPLFTRFWIA